MINLPVGDKINAVTEGVRMIELAIVEGAVETREAGRAGVNQY